MSICFLLQAKFQHTSCHQRVGKFLQLIPSLRSGIALPRACMTAGLSSWLLVSFWVIWRASWYGVKMGLYFFTHLSAGWIIWCPLRDVVCHGEKGEKKKNQQSFASTSHTVSLHSLWESLSWAKVLFQTCSDKLYSDGGKAGRACHVPRLQLPPSEGRWICGIGKKEWKMKCRWEMEAQPPPPKGYLLLSVPSEEQ